MLLMRGALSSGAVSSSWIWNLLTAVFTVTSLLASGSSSGRHFALRSRYVAFTLLLAAYLPVVSYTAFPGRFQAGCGVFSLPVNTAFDPRPVHWASVAPFATAKEA